MSVSSNSGAGNARDSLSRSHLARTSPKKRPRGFTPRSYQAQMDLCRLRDLMMQNRGQAEIARMMGKDAAWVSRSVKKIQADLSTVFMRPREEQMVNEHLSRLESLYATAIKSAEDDTGMAKVAAIRTANSLLRDKMQFMQFVGLIRKDQENPIEMQLGRIIDRL